MKGAKDVNNLTIREQILKNGLRYYMVAEKLGIGETTFCRWLRRELSPEREKEVLQAIDELVQKRKGAENGI